MTSRQGNPWFEQSPRSVTATLAEIDTLHREINYGVPEGSINGRRYATQVMPAIGSEGQTTNAPNNLPVHIPAHQPSDPFVNGSYGPAVATPGNELVPYANRNNYHRPSQSLVPVPQTAQHRQTGSSRRPGMSETARRWIGDAAGASIAIGLLLLAGAGVNHFVIDGRNEPRGQIITPHEPSPSPEPTASTSSIHWPLQ